MDMPFENINSEEWMRNYLFFYANEIMVQTVRYKIKQIKLLFIQPSVVSRSARKEKFRLVLKEINTRNVLHKMFILRTECRIRQKLEPKIFLYRNQSAYKKGVEI